MKFLGYLFIVLGALISIVIFGQIGQYIINFARLIAALGGNYNGYNIGFLLGTASFQLLVILLGIMFFHYGIKWIKPKNKVK